MIQRGIVMDEGNDVDSNFRIGRLNWEAELVIED